MKKTLSLLLVCVMLSGLVACGAAKPAGGGGGGGGGREYDITVEKSAHGTVTPEWDSAMKGDTVTLTVDPDKGYALETLTALDKNGKEIKLIDNGNGEYTFTIPVGKVTVETRRMLWARSLRTS